MSLPPSTESPREVYYEHLDEMRRECDRHGLMFVEELTRTIRAWFCFRGLPMSSMLENGPAPDVGPGITAEAAASTPPAIEPTWEVVTEFTVDGRARRRTSIIRFVRWSEHESGSRQAVLMTTGGSKYYLPEAEFRAKIAKGRRLDGGGDLP